MFEFKVASTIEDLRRGTGSFYQPVEISDILREIAADRRNRWAIVGVPCLCAAVRNLKHLRSQVPFVFGLACGMYQNVFYTEMLLAKSRVDPTRVLRIEYRRKTATRAPSNYGFRGSDSTRVGREVPYRDLPFFLGKHAYFRLNACNFCRDVFAETADACFMDAWLPEYRDDSRGTSLVVIRTAIIEQLLHDGARDGEIYLEAASAEQAVRSQAGHVVRKRHAIRSRISPDAGASIRERIEWWLQRQTQVRSKHAWRRWGRRYGPMAFWAIMADLLILQTALQFSTRWLHVLVQVCRRVLPLRRK